jgi:23S rRNA pseudouridine2605 synthase
MGARVVPYRDIVELDGTRVDLPGLRWLAFHKPAGVLTTRSDPHGGTTVYDILPPDAKGLRYVGRLDRETTGLLLLTNDGDVANALMHPSGGVEREYRAVVGGVPSDATFRRLQSGVTLEDGPARAKRAWLERPLAGGAGARIGLVLVEGRKREVRRLLEAVEHPVRELERVRFGPIELGDLALGAWRELDDDERRRLRERSGAGDGMGDSHGTA